ncbi:hypothetical protein [Paenarthrobacter sp. NPDC090522]|uniref:hypothetical protein n=1 Tax=Paenarthrobacter sp. NPDC090522 TaxID=3364383 RepID=UPI00380BEC93
MTVVVREHAPADEPLRGTDHVHHGDVCQDVSVLAGPTHCGSSMAISSGPGSASMQWTSVEPIWPEWACGCGFRMDIDAMDPVSSVWVAAQRWQSLEHELAIARNTFQLAFKKAVDSGLEREALARAIGVVPADVEALLQ